MQVMDFCWSSQISLFTQNNVRIYLLNFQLVINQLLTTHTYIQIFCLLFKVQAIHTRVANNKNCDKNHTRSLISNVM